MILFCYIILIGGLHSVWLEAIYIYYVAVILCLCVYGFICEVCFVLIRYSFVLVWCPGRAALRDCDISCVFAFILLHNMCKVENKTVWYMQKAKGQMSLCIRSVWSGYFLFIDKYYNIHWPVNQSKITIKQSQTNWNLIQIPRLTGELH